MSKKRVDEILDNEEIEAILGKHQLTPKEKKLVKWFIKQWGALGTNQRLKRIQTFIRGSQRYGKATRWHNATLEIIVAFNRKRNGI